MEEAKLEFKPGNEAATFSQGEKSMIIQPASLNDPKLIKLKEVLVDWINTTLKPEHIVVQTLEDDLFDGLVLHHLLGRLGGVHIAVEEIAVTSTAQIRKLELILTALNRELGLSSETDTTEKWSVKQDEEVPFFLSLVSSTSEVLLDFFSVGLLIMALDQENFIHSRDLLATLHLLVAMVKCYQPDLVLPAGVTVEVVLFEVSKSGIKSDKYLQEITSLSEDTEEENNRDPIDELLKLDAHKIGTVKKAILHFVNKNMSPLRLQVVDMEKQFADGVILLLLIGELEGFFIPLYEFHLSPTCHSEMLHNVTLALDLLNDKEMQVPGVDPEDIVSQDVPATLKVLYALFKRHKNK